MDLASGVPKRSYFRPPTEVLGGIVVGILGAVVVLAGLGSTNSLLVPLAALVGLPVIAAIILKPRWGMLLFLFSIAFVEEFRGGIGDTGAGGDEFLRSERTPFYAKTFGLPALYLPDIMIGTLLALFLLRVLLNREPIALRFDKIGVALFLMALAVVFSILVPLMGPQPFGPEVLDLSTIGSLTLPEKNVTDVARYLPVLQYKLFLIVFPAYILGLLFFRERKDIDQTVIVVGVAMVATVILGLSRIARDPGVVKNLVPVVFDTGSVALMALTVFYLVARWASNHYSIVKASAYALLCGFLVALILLSFRRTMWAAIALSLVFFPFLIPRHAIRRLFVIVGLGAGLGLLLLISTPPGQAILHSLVSRAEQTNLNQGSTLYRFAIMTWVVNNYADIPIFGYGLAPMWNEKVYIRFFVISMENVHSLYIWLLIRLGLLGFLVSGVAAILCIARLREVYRSISVEQYRILVGVIFLSIVMFLFNGLLNPVYADVRHLVPLGLSLAMVTRLPEILRRSAPPKRPPASP